MQGVAESTVGTPEVDHEEIFEMERGSARQRTLVIVLAQVVALVVFAVVWSIIRSRRSTD